MPPVEFWQEVEALAQLCGMCHQHPGTEVVVAAEVFGGRIDGDVGAEVEGALQHRGQKSVVDTNSRPRSRQRMPRAARSATPSRGFPGVSTSSALLFGRMAAATAAVVAGINVADAQPQFAEDLVKDPVGAAVKILGDHQVVSAGKVQEEGGQRRHPRGEGQSAGAPLELGKSLLEQLAGRITRAGVVVTGALADTGVAVGGARIDREAEPPVFSSRPTPNWTSRLSRVRCCDAWSGMVIPLS